MISIYQIDAFSAKPFSGNPAAVCPLTEWLDDAVMQSIAAENNLAETAFFAPEGDGYRLRWFTPSVEVKLCGHATLTSGYVVLNLLTPGKDRVVFYTLSGPLEVWRDGSNSRLAMSLPAAKSLPLALSDDLLRALGAKPVELYQSNANGYYVMAVYDKAETVQQLSPDQPAIAGLCNGLIVTARAPVNADFDIVSRFFAPAMGIPEDPVTGSAHCQIIPYWAARLGKADLTAYQASPRGGWLYCSNAGERVIFRGDCAFFMKGEINL